MRSIMLLLVAGCAQPVSEREGRILDTLAEDNYAWALRDPALVALKLRKMQRGPYEWLRGTAALYWRDVMEPGGDRGVTAFGDARSARVLLVGDPHPENAGTFRASDGTMFVDWNDFDATGYGPYEGDLRRLATGFSIIAPEHADELVRIIATSYAAQIAELATGARVGAIGLGVSPLFDKELDKARTRGDAGFAIDEFAPLTNGVRALALGDLEPVAADGVLEDRVVAVTAEEADWIARALPGRSIELAARRIGPGVSSYPAYRFDVVLAGDRIIELKETRDGVIIHGVPQLEGSEWATPAERSIDTQRRLHARPDGDALLAAAQVGGLSLKIRDREAYQRGIDAEDLAELPADELRDIARLYGALLARAHGQALTADRVLGYTVIAPLLAGREVAFADELAAFAAGDTGQVIADHALMRDRDLGAAIGAP
ncbi:MAG: DUF2252 family protein [Kofleriaceae bacterium]